MKTFLKIGFCVPMAFKPTKFILFLLKTSVCICIPLMFVEAKIAL